MEISNVCYYDAKITEIDNWKQHYVYHEVSYHWQHLISLRWVCSIKETNAGFVPNVRLVTKGFDENDKQNVPAELPTCLWGSLHILIAFSFQQNWKLNATDIKKAFLQEQSIICDIYVIPPKEAQTNSIWNLEKCI